MQLIAKHVYGSIYDVKGSTLSDAQLLMDILKASTKIGMVHIVKTCVEKFDVQKGVSIVIILSESHIALHTWPEAGYATLDIYTCGADSKPWDMFLWIVSQLKAGSYKILVKDRGVCISKKQQVH